MLLQELTENEARWCRVTQVLEGRKTYQQPDEKSKNPMGR